MVKYLRYRKDPKPGKNRTYMNLKDIANLLNKSQSYVSKICEDLKKPQCAPKSQSKEIILTVNQYLESEPISKHKFTEQQQRYLLSDQTLRRWSGHSIDERVALFKKRYPYSHCTVYKLRKFYQKHGVKKKVIRVGKVLPPRAMFEAHREA